MTTKFIVTLALEFTGKPMKKSVRESLQNVLQENREYCASDRQGNCVCVLKARVRSVDED